MMEVELTAGLTMQAPGSTYPEGRAKGDRISLADDEAQRFIDRGFAVAVAGGKRVAETAAKPLPETSAKTMPAKKAKPKKK